MSEVTKPILLDETGQSIVTKLGEIKSAIQSSAAPGEPVLIEVITSPKTEYQSGETLDLTGIVVGAKFSNNALYDVTSQCTFSPDEGTTITGDVNVTISWYWYGTQSTLTTTLKVGLAPYQIPMWSTGTDAEIVEALEKHYAGDIDLTQYWSVGQERTIHLSAISEDSSLHIGDSHVAQDIVVVLLHEGGKMLADGETECAFVIGQKYALKNDSTHLVESGCMYSTEKTNNYVGWESSERRTWCNTNFRNAIPSSIRGIFLQHINHTDGDVNGGSDYETIDYFELPCEKEYLGTTNYARSSESPLEADMPYLTYYQTTTNRVKISSDIIGRDIDGDNVNNYSHWMWLRTSGYSSANSYENNDYVSVNWPKQVSEENGITPYSKGNSDEDMRGLCLQGVI